MKRRSPSILIVEDENTIARDLEQLLASLGYCVAGVVDSCREAIRVAEEVRPDLALMDLQLIGPANSVIAANEIRSRLKIPIVFLMAKSDEEASTRAKAIDPCAYIVKPFRSTELNAVISLALDRHQLVQKIFAEQTWLATMLRSLNDAVIATDDEGRISFLNSTAEDLTGWTLREALGFPIERIYELRTIAGEKVEKCQLRLALELKEATPRERFLLTSRMGLTTPIDDSAAPIVEHEQLLGAVAIFRDIKDILKREEMLARERDRAEERMVITAEALGETQSDLRSLSEHLINSHEKDRRRLAKYLHDDFSQRTALVGLQVERLMETLPDNSDAQEQLRAIQTQVEALSEGLRRTSHSLHPSVLSDLGFLPALRELIQEFQARGLNIRLRAKGNLSAGIPSEITVALYRIAEEAIGNALRHAGKSVVSITVSEEGGQFHLVLEDSGSGFDLAEVRARGGLGLLTMHERARMVGGNLLVRSAPGQGTQVVVRVPLA